MRTPYAGDPTFLDQYWSQGVWAKRQEFWVRRGWTRGVQATVDMDGAAHIVYALELGKAGR